MQWTLYSGDCTLPELGPFVTLPLPESDQKKGASKLAPCKEGVVQIN